jgi:hypothetical protein
MSRRPVAFVATLLTLSVLVTATRTSALELNQEVSGFFRICSSQEGFSELRKAAQESAMKNDFRTFENFMPKYCAANYFTFTPVKEQPEFSSFSWNYIYDAKSAETCHLTIDAREVKIPCRAEIKPARYYLAAMVRPDGGLIYVMVEVFSTELTAEYFAARRAQKR